VRPLRFALIASLLLVGCGVRVENAITGFKETDLQSAIKAHDVAAVKRLVESGAEMGHTFGETQGAWELSLRNLSPSDPRTIEIARLVIEHHPVREPRGPGPAKAQVANRLFSIPRTRGPSVQTSAVEIAARQWSVEGVQLLLDHGLQIHSPAVGDALVAAASNGCEPVITLLLDAGASANARDREGDAPLAMARRVHNPGIAVLLISRGAREPKPKPSGAVLAATEAAIGRVFGPDPMPSPEAEPLWFEGVEILSHPVGAAAQRLAESGETGSGGIKLPSPAALTKGLETASALTVKGKDAELHVIAAGDAPPAILKFVFELQQGEWRRVE
jgi:hypothetical protein